MNVPENGRCHHDDEVSGIEGLKRQLIADQIEENGGTDSVAAAKLFIFCGIESC